MSKYPQAAGAALYTHKAFGVPFFTFMVAFAVMSSGIASASMARAFAGDYLSEFVDLELVVAAIIFILIVAAINLRGISESVTVNLVLTAIEATGLVIIVIIGVAALSDGSADFSRNFEFEDGESVFAVLVGGTALSFYALIGFEDSVNVAEETKRPSQTFPRALFTGLVVAGVLYLLVTLTASAVVPTGQLSGSDAPLLEVVEVGPLGFSTRLFSFIALMAVSNSALINMIMASRIVYGMAEQGIVARVFGRVLPGRRTPIVAILFTTLIAVILITTGDLESLADTTVLLLLSVFTIVNIAVLVLRRQRWSTSTSRRRRCSRCWARSFRSLIVDTALDDLAVFARAAILLVIGVVLWFVNRVLAGPPEDVQAEGLRG